MTRTYNIALTLEHPEDFRTEDELETLVESRLCSTFVGDYRFSVFDGAELPEFGNAVFPPVWKGFETAVSADSPTTRPVDCTFIAVHEFAIPVEDDDFVEGAQVVYVGHDEGRSLAALQGKHGYIEIWSNGERLAVAVKN